MGKEENPLEFEFDKIKQYVINPIEVGLWETTFIAQPLTEFSHMINNFFQPISNQSIPLLTTLSNMYYIANPINQGYNINAEEQKYINDFISTHKIEIINNSLRINNESCVILPYSHYTYAPKIRVLSLHKTLGENLQNILNELKYASFEKMEKRFSPKNILFEPYFFYTSQISDSIFSSTQEELDYFKNAFDSYNNKNNEESMRKIGKAFESTLTRIYETLLRKDASLISSIGKLLNNIESEVKNILTDENEVKKYTLNNISQTIYKECKNLENNNEDSVQKTINVFKGIAESIEMQLKKTDQVLFPNIIQGEIQNILELRNQVSHHNTTISTNENAINMLFSYIQVYLWWEEASQSITNWDASKKEIIKKFEELRKDKTILNFRYFSEKCLTAPHSRTYSSHHYRS